MQGNTRTWLALKVCSLGFLWLTYGCQTAQPKPPDSLTKITAQAKFRYPSSTYIVGVGEVRSGEVRAAEKRAQMDIAYQISGRLSGTYRVSASQSNARDTEIATEQIHIEAVLDQRLLKRIKTDPKLSKCTRNRCVAVVYIRRSQASVMYREAFDEARVSVDRLLKTVDLDTPNLLGLAKRRQALLQQFETMRMNQSRRQNVEGNHQTNELPAPYAKYRQRFMALNAKHFQPLILTIHPEATLSFNTSTDLEATPLDDGRLNDKVLSQAISNAVLQAGRENNLSIQLGSSCDEGFLVQPGGEIQCKETMGSAVCTLSIQLSVKGCEGIGTQQWLIQDKRMKGGDHRFDYSSVQGHLKKVLKRKHTKARLNSEIEQLTRTMR